MNLLYSGAVGYGRFKNFWGAIIMSILGVLFMISGIYTFFFPTKPIPSTQSTPSISNSQPNNTDTTTPYGWSILSVLGVIFIIISGVLYFLATDNSETTKNILAAQSAYDAYSSIFGNRRNGGNFTIGE